MSSDAGVRVLRQFKGSVSLETDWGVAKPGLAKELGFGGGLCHGTKKRSIPFDEGVRSG